MKQILLDNSELIVLGLLAAHFLYGAWTEYFKKKVVPEDWFESMQMNKVRYKSLRRNPWGKMIEIKLGQEKQ